MVELTIALKIVADHRIWRDTHVLVQNCPFDARTTADIAIVENYGIFHECAGMDTHAPADHRATHGAAGHDRTAGEDGVDCHSAPPCFVEHKLGRCIEITCRA